MRTSPSEPDTASAPAGTPLVGMLKGHFTPMSDMVTAMILIATRAGNEAAKVRSLREMVAGMRQAANARGQISVAVVSFGADVEVAVFAAGAVIEHDFGPQRLRVGELHCGRIMRHHDGCTYPEPPRRPRHALGMIAR